MTAVERLDPDLTVQGNEIVLQGVTYQVVRRDDVDEKSRRALVNRDPWRWMVALKRPRGQRVYVTFMTEGWAHGDRSGRLGHRGRVAIMASHRIGELLNHGDKLAQFRGQYIDYNQKENRAYVVLRARGQPYRTGG
jgi:hypothetical protein